MYNIFPGLTPRVLSLRKDVLQLQFIPDVHRGILEASNKNMGERLGPPHQENRQNKLSRFKRVVGQALGKTLGQAGERFIGFLEEHQEAIRAARHGPLSMFPDDDTEYWQNKYRQQDSMDRTEDKEK